MFSTINVFFILLFNFSFVNSVHWKNNNNNHSFISNNFDVLLNYLKPFSNIENVKSDNKNIERKSQCDFDMEILIEAVNNYELWALKMLDSSGKLGSGVLSGNIKMLGHYDQCVMHQSRDLSAQYCLATLQVKPSPQHNKHKEIEQLFDMATMGRAKYEIMKDEDRPIPDLLPTVSEIQLGVCVPASCSASEIQLILNSAFKTSGQKFKISATVKHHDCSSNNNKLPWTNFDKVFISLLIIIIIFTMICTAIDSQTTSNADLGQMKSYYQIFSISKNWERLINTNNSGTFTCVNGIRAISTFFIILTHKFYYHMQEPLINKDQFKDELTAFWNMPLSNTLINVDTFFLLSGLLRGYGLFQDYKKKQNNFVNSLWKRYLRLTPCVAVIIGLYISIVPRLGSGPYWYKTVMSPARDACTQNWIYNLLYLSNYINNDVHCVNQTWYLSADMQLYIIAPLLIYPTWRWPKKSIKIFATTIFSGIFINFIYIYWNSTFPTVLPSSSNQQVLDFQFYLHNHTHHRYAVYTIGLALSYILFLIKDKDIQLSKTYIILGWTLCLTAMYAVTFGSHKYFQYDYKYDVLEMAFYGAIHRPVWVAAIAWIIFASHTGYGGWINTILSTKIFQILSKLSYCVFLTHYVVLMMSTGRIRTAFYMDKYDLLRFIFGDIIISLIASILLHIFIEAPVMEGIKYMKNTDTKAEKKRTQNVIDNSTSNMSSVVKHMSAKLSSILKFKKE